MMRILALLFITISLCAVRVSAQNTDMRVDEKSAVKPQEKDDKDKVRFTFGVISGMSTRDDFNNIQADIPFGFIVQRVGIIFNPSLVFLKSDSFNFDRGKALNEFFRPKGSGFIYDLGISMKAQYYFKDPATAAYAPYLGAGPGYDYRGYEYKVRTFAIRQSKSYFLHSLTLNYGGGFMFKAREFIRITIDLGAISYFNKKDASRFTYDTTGATLGMGAHLLL